MFALVVILGLVRACLADTMEPAKAKPKLIKPKHTHHHHVYLPPPVPQPPYTTNAIRGVNLAGWFIAEPWITQSLFAPYANRTPRPIDEFTMVEALGPAEARRVLEAHWDTFITRSDFEWMKVHGINACKIPVGYWAYDLRPGESYVDGQIPYINRALGWAAEFGIKCVIELAGAPESQNGFASSGHDDGVFWTNRTAPLAKGTLTWYDINFEEYPYMARTVDVIRLMVKAHTTNETIDGLLGYDFVGDVPQAVATPVYNGFMIRARSAALSTLDLVDVSATVTARLRAFMGDAYRGNDWRRRWTSGSFPRSVMDMHVYLFTTPDALLRTPDQQIFEVCEHYSVLFRETTIPSIVGAFSVADTDCAQYYNGVNDGHRILGTFGQFKDFIHGCGGDYSDDTSRWSPSRRQYLTTLFQAQIRVYEDLTEGWFFQTYKTERAPVWDFRRLVDLGIINLASWAQFNPCSRF